MSDEWLKICAHPFDDTVLGAPIHQCLLEFTCIKEPPPAPSTVKYTCDYYTWRHQNFLDRHKGCGHVPPRYYLCYGYKYCMRFTLETRPKMTDGGKKWLDGARDNLQDAMEKLIAPPSLVELDSQKHWKAAFLTHGPAYCAAGIENLSFLPGGGSGVQPDWVDLLRTPDSGEFTELETWPPLFKSMGCYVSGQF